MPEINNVEEMVEKSIYEAIRKALVTFEYLPDITVYSQDKSGREDFEKAIQTLNDRGSPKDFSIDLKGFSGTKAKGEIAVPRISLTTLRPLPGDIGRPIRYKEKTLDGQYQEFLTSHTSFNLQIQIKITWQLQRHLRAAVACIAYALGTRGYIPFYNTLENNQITPQTQFFYIEDLNVGYDARDSDIGNTETIYVYEVRDLNLVDDKSLTVNKPITDININIETQDTKTDNIFKQTN